jgi:hypothetical protein
LALLEETPARIEPCLLDRPVPLSRTGHIESAGIREGGKAPLFRSGAGRTSTLTEKPMNRVDAWRMIQRRAADLGTRVKISGRWGHQTIGTKSYAMVLSDHHCL